jgi:hypothetical protein
MKTRITLIILLICGQLSAKPNIEQLAGITVGKPIEAPLLAKIRKGDPRNQHSNAMYMLEKVPEFKKIANCDVSLFVVAMNGGNVASMEIRFKAGKGNRSSVFAWVKEELNIAPEEFEDGRLIYTEKRNNGYTRSLSLGSYTVGMEDREYVVSISEQKN